MSINLLRLGARYARRNTQRLYHTIGYLVLPAIILAVVAMWLINIAGGQGVNFIFFVAGIYALAIFALKPKMLLIAAGLGIIVDGLNDKDITQGSVRGVQVLFNALFGVLFYFTACAATLSFISFAASPAAFWGYIVIITCVSALFAYLNISTGKWMVRIVVVFAVVMSVILAGQLFLPTGVQMLIRNFYYSIDKEAERAATITRTCADDPSNAVCVVQVEEPEQDNWTTAKDSGQIIAPVQRYSVWVLIPFGKCLAWWTDDPKNDNDVARRYVERETGEVYAGDGKGVKKTARSWKSKIGRPVRVSYELGEPDPIDGSCPDDI